MQATDCPCGSSKSFQDCCEEYIAGKRFPKTPEALMRSRYTAYAQANIDYIQHTMQGKAAQGFVPEEALQWAKSVTWLGLKVLFEGVSTFKKEEGIVEFIATYQEKDQIKTMHERSKFRRHAGRWYYVGRTTPRLNEA